MLKDALGPWVLARTFSRWPLSEPSRSTVWFLWGPADVSTAIWVSLNLRREGSGSEAAAASVHALVGVPWICRRPQEAWADAALRPAVNHSISARFLRRLRPLISRCS